MSNELPSFDVEDLENYEELPTQETYQDILQENYQEDNDQNTEDNFDLTKELLAKQGIEDINKIKFEDESGAIVEKSWESLTNEEKVMILSHQEDPDTSLDASEIELINLIRESGLTPDQFIQNLQAVPQPTYEVDSMSDEELFCLDLLDKIGSDNITDEELQKALEDAKQNESLFNKQVASLRVYYKRLEDENAAQVEYQKQQESEQRYNQFANAVVNSIQYLHTLDDIPVELSTDEMENLADYILTRDGSGYSTFGRLLNDPMQFTKAAFWMLKGPELLNEMQNLIKEAYIRGYNEKNPKKQVVIRPQKANNNNKESLEANFSEDSYLND